MLLAEITVPETCIDVRVDDDPSALYGMWALSLIWISGPIKGPIVASVFSSRSSWPVLYYVCTHPVTLKQHDDQPPELYCNGRYRFYGALGVQLYSD
jgi:hypothetical protein